MSWWTRNAEAKGAEHGKPDTFYDRAYESSTAKAAPTSDSRTGETFDNSPTPARGWPFGRPASS